MITRDEIEALLTAKAEIAVSIFTPTNMPSLAIRQDSIRLGNQIDQARKRLAAAGWRDVRIEKVLEPAVELLDNTPFWADATPGLAIFLAEGHQPRLWRLPQTVEELVVVGSRFHIAPLLPLFEGEGIFYVLALSSAHARLFRADRQGMREIKDGFLPQGGVQAVVRQNTDYEPGQSANPIAARRSGRGGNSGQPGSVPQQQALGPTGEEESKTEFLHYLDLVASAFDRHFGAVQAPVILAAQPELAGNFRTRTNARNLLADTVDINPDAIDTADLHRRALALIEPRLKEQTDKAIDHFNSLYNDHSPRASLEPAEIVKAARWGKMDTLILAEGEHLWGRFDEAGNRVETHPQPEAVDDDLLDLAVQQTLLNGGEVRVVARDHVPGGATCAAIMRY